jgi:phosphoglycerol transferase
MRRWLLWLFPPVVVVAAIWIALGGWHWNPRAPLVFDGDALFYLAQTKSTVDNGWWWYNPLIGAPLGLHALTFPQNTNVDQVIVWTVSRFTDHIGLVANTSWILMVALSAVTATWGLRRLGVSAAAAGVAAVLFALTPFALYRHLGHFALVIYLLPIPATIGVLLASGAGNERWPTRAWIVPLAGCVLVGFDYIYFAFFGAFLVLVATIVGAAVARSGMPVRKGAIFLTVIALATALNMVPNMIAWQTYGRPKGVTHIASESETYGLKVRHLVSPTGDTWFPPLQAWLDRERAARFSNDNENITARLGLVTAISFVGLLGVLIFPSAVPLDERRRRVRAAALLAMAAVLLATVGGIGSLFSLFVTADVRSYNRISPFIAFFSIAGLALWLDRPGGRLRPHVRTAILAAVLVVGLADQMPALRGRNLASSSIEADFAAVSSFVATLEHHLPDQAMVFQLPTRPYPLDPGDNPIGVYSQFKPYMTSHHLRWSYPAMNPDQLKWERAANALPEAELPRYLAHEGFSAILITRDGFPDRGEQRERLLTDPAAGATVLATSDRYLALDIRSLRQAASVPASR